MSHIQLSAEMTFLVGGRGVMSKIIQADFADGVHEWSIVAIEALEGSVILIGERIDVVWMYADGRRHSFVPSCQLDTFGGTGHIDADADDTAEGNGKGSGQYLVEVVSVGLHVEMTMGVDEGVGAEIDINGGMERD